MTKSRSGQVYVWWLSGVVVLLLVVAVVLHFTLGKTGTAAHAQESESSAQSSNALTVEVTHPLKGGVQRITTQPGTVQAYESVQLVSAVSGFLKTQQFDIGDTVKNNQVLAVLDVPELEKQVEESEATVGQAEAKVKQMEAHRTSAEAEVTAAKATVQQSEAASKSAEAWTRFRALQLTRRRELWASRSIEEKLVEESQEHHESAVEAERTAKAAVATARAQQAAAEARVLRADADVLAAQAEVKVAKAKLDKAKVMLAYATITAPFDGVITYRGYFPKDFIRATSGESSQRPLFTVVRTDRFRVVVQVPDRDVPFATKGDEAIVEIDALPGKKFPARISRISRSEDPQTRLMHVEIDVENTTGEICQGMFGHVTIILDKSNGLAIPTSCLVKRSDDGEAKVFVVRDGHARLVPIQIKTDNGIHVAVTAGLTPEDKVVLNPESDLTDGTPVVTLSSGSEHSSH